jgi:hypothetical protein
MSAIVRRGPNTRFDFNVKGVIYEVIQNNKPYSEYTGNGEEERVIDVPTMGNYMIREKMTSH